MPWIRLVTTLLNRARLRGADSLTFPRYCSPGDPIGLAMAVFHCHRVTADHRHVAVASALDRARPLGRQRHGSVAGRGCLALLEGPVRSPEPQGVGQRLLALTHLVAGV